MRYYKGHSEKGEDKRQGGDGDSHRTLLASIVRHTLIAVVWVRREHWMYVNAGVSASWSWLWGKREYPSMTRNNVATFTHQRWFWFGGASLLTPNCPSPRRPQQQPGTRRRAVAPAARSHTKRHHCRSGRDLPAKHPHMPLH